jgi:hypothetical protein
MADVTSKQQTTALFLSTIVKRKHRTDKHEGKPVLCKRTFSSVFCAVFYTVKLHDLTRVYGALIAAVVEHGKQFYWCVESERPKSRMLERGA